MEQNAPTPQWIKAPQFARLTGIPVRTVYKLVQDGEIRGAVKIGGAVLIPASEVDDLFTRGKIAA